MGGDMQRAKPCAGADELDRLRMNIQMAGDAARVRHDGSATPTGQPEDRLVAPSSSNQGSR